MRMEEVEEGKKLTISFSRGSWMCLREGASGGKSEGGEKRREAGGGCKGNVIG